MKVTIEAYKYEDLDHQSQWDALVWLDECPLDYEDENGETKWEYFTDMETQDVIEHCEANEYLFNKFGEPIHHLIEK
jgi:hypothetical protein